MRSGSLGLGFRGVPPPCGAEASHGDQRFVILAETETRFLSTFKIRV